MGVQVVDSNDEAICVGHMVKNIAVDAWEIANGMLLFMEYGIGAHD